MKRSFLLTSFIFPLILLSQLEEDFIKWDENRKLTWEDFKAAPLKMGSTAAMTTTHLGFSYNFANGKITYKIDCQFEKNRSWGLVKNDWILKHEQGHFDIAEIYARKLNKIIKAYTFRAATAQKEVPAIYQKIMNDLSAMQNQYDSDTDFSRDKEQQAAWTEKINRELYKLNEFAGYH